MGNAEQVRDLQQLLASADIVTLHVPDTAATRNMFGREQLAAMKPGAVLINAARGQVIDIDALTEQLRSGHLGGAAIDVFPVEPKGNNEEFVSPLRAFDNVILTPHIGGSTQEAQANIGVEVAEKLATYSDSGTTTSAVNFPQVALPAQADRHRLLHVHRNTPGVMTAINQILSAHQINIAAQYLQTSGEVGYVVVDIDGEYSDAAIADLKAVAGTVRCRVLF
jgi:D-3-phosphoglycerate dehydrogenase